MRGGARISEGQLQSAKASACQGELTEQALLVRAVDGEGKVLVDEAMTTMQNAFWNCGFPETAGSP
ncbi:MAG: hypothetical protein AB1558_04070 [Thermodesulfobacteriota bacterium]